MPSTAKQSSILTSSFNLAPCFYYVFVLYKYTHALHVILSVAVLRFTQASKLQREKERVIGVGVPFRFFNGGEFKSIREASDVGCNR